MIFIICSKGFVPLGVKCRPGKGWGSTSSGKGYLFLITKIGQLRKLLGDLADITNRFPITARNLFLSFFCDPIFVVEYQSRYPISMSIGRNPFDQIPNIILPFCIFFFPRLICMGDILDLKKQRKSPRQNLDRIFSSPFKRI